MNIGVIGGGAIGLLTSYYLSKQGHSVTVYVQREEQRNDLLKKGITLLPSGDQVLVNASTHKSLGNHELFIVCTKQHAIPSLVDDWKGKNDCPVIFIQNGMGHIPYVRKLPNPVLLGIMEHGALRENDTAVRHTGEGQLRLAHFSIQENRLDTFVEQLSSDKFPIHLENDWYNMLCQKLVVNAVINPVTTLFGIKNGEILTNPYIERMSERLCEEACTILSLSHHVQWPRIKQIASLTQANTSSMLKDIQAKRETEVEAILGFLLEETSSHVPYITYMYQSIKALEFELQKERGI